MMKKRMFLLAACLVLVTGMIFAAAMEAKASGAAQPSIKVTVAAVPLQRHRNIQYYGATQIGMGFSHVWDNDRIVCDLYLLNENKEVIGGPYEYDRSEYSIFLPSEDGTYYIRVGDAGAYGNYLPATKVHNGTGNYTVVYQGDFISEPIVVSGGTVSASSATLRWMFETRAYGFEVSTEKGKFSNDEQALQYFPLLPSSVEGGPRNGCYKDGNDWLYTRSGIYYGESASMYSGMTSLEEPILSAEDQALGYVFKGWMYEGNMYSEAQALGIPVTKNVVLEAVFELPEHTVTFTTDVGKGTIDGGGSKTETIQGNVFLTSGQIPVPVPGEEYVFVGWYTDPSSEQSVNPAAQRVTGDITYYAKYEEKTYAVTYDANGGNGAVPTDSARYTKNAPVTVKAGDGLTKENVLFAGWNTQADGEGVTYQPNSTFPIQGDTTLYAKWGEAVTVAFDAQGGDPVPAEQTILKGSSAAPPAAPQKPGQEFQYWYLEDENTPYDFDASVNGNITLKAKWKDWAKGSITVQFGTINTGTTRNEWQYNGGGTAGWATTAWWGSAKATLYTEAGEPVGSYTDESTYTFSGLPAGKYYIHLDFTNRYLLEIVDISADVRLMVDADNNSPLIEISEASPSATRRAIVEPLAYGVKATTERGTFTGGGQEKDYFPMPDYTTKRNFTVTKGSTTYNTHAGVYHGDSVSQYTRMNALEIPVLSDEDQALGYEFKGWRYGGSTLTEAEALATVVRGDIVFEAVFELPTRTVTFLTDTDKGKINGGASSEVQLAGNTYLTDSQVPNVQEENGYTFLGWYLDPVTTNLVDPTQNRVTGDLTYYAKYEEEESYTVTFVSDETRGYLYEAPENVSLKTTITYRVPAGKTLQEAAGYVPVIQSTTFPGDSHDVSSPKTWRREITGVLTKDVEDSEILGAAVTADTVYYVNWLPLYTISFTDPQGNANHTGVYAAGDTVTVPTAQDVPPYYFREWDPAPAANRFPASGDAAFTALYEYHPDYNVFFVDPLYAPGNAVWTRRYDASVRQYMIYNASGSPVSESDRPHNGSSAVEGYTFMGWSGEMVPNGDSVFTAIWKADDAGKFTVTFVDPVFNRSNTATYDISETGLSGKINSQMPDYRVGGTYDYPNQDGTATQYIFRGWNPSVDTASLEDAVYVAAWERVPDKCEVYFVDGFGTTLYTTVVPSGTSGARVSAPSAPTKNGYRFAGWSPKLDSVGVITGNMTFTAVWDKEHSVTYVNPFGSGAVATYYTWDEFVQITPPAVTDVTGYRFTGWQGEKIFGVDSVITAKWAPVEEDSYFTVTFVTDEGRGRLAENTNAANIHALKSTISFRVPAGKTLAEADGYVPYIYSLFEHDYYAANPEQNIGGFDENYHTAIGVGTPNWRREIPGELTKNVSKGEILNQSVTADTVYYVNWLPLYTINFVDPQGNASSSRLYVAGDSVYRPTAVDVPPYYFTGWSPTPVQENARHDATYTAQYDYHPDYSVTFVDPLYGPGNTVLTRKWDPIVGYKYFDAAGQPAVFAFPHQGRNGSVSLVPGYVFERWEGILNENGDSVFTAIWHAVNEDTFTVTFVDTVFNGSSTATYRKGDIENPGKISDQAPNYIVNSEHTAPNGIDKYMFLGWAPAVDTNSEEDAVYVTQWELVSRAEECEVYFVDGFGHTLKKMKVDSNSPASGLQFPEDPNMDGYSFVGWSPNPGDVDRITGNMTFTAVWEKQEKYTVTFIDTVGNGNKVVEYTTRAEFDRISYPTMPAMDTPHNGYVFQGWEGQMIYGVDSVLVAKWLPASSGQYTVTFVDTVGGRSSTVSYEKGKDNRQAVAQQTPRYAVDNVYTFGSGEYVFAGWSPAVQPDAQTDMTYTAEWRRIYSVTFDKGWGDSQTAGYRYGEDVRVPYDLIPGGTETHDGVEYRFLYWSPALRPVTGDIVYTAVWSEADNPNPVYTVIYTDGLGGALFQDHVYSVTKTGTEAPETPKLGSGGGRLRALRSAAQDIVDKNQDQIRNSIDPSFTMPARDGYLFAGWSPKWQSTVTEDVVYTAVWVKEDESYTVTYADGFGSSQEYPGLALGDVTPEDPYGFRVGGSMREVDGARTMDSPHGAGIVMHYVFKGWSPEISPVVKGDAVYTAIWELNVRQNPDSALYTVAFLDEDQSVIERYMARYGDRLFVPTPTKEGYTFEKWTPSPTVGSYIFSDMTFVASWTPAEDTDVYYNIIYKSGVDQGVSFPDQVIRAKAGDYTPNFIGYPRRTDGEGNWLFKEWSPAVAEKVTGNAVYTAQWVKAQEGGAPAAETFTVTYADGVGGAVFADQRNEGLKRNDPTPAFKGGTPQRKDYEFKGWTPAVADQVTRDVVYFAVWEPLAGEETETFTVIYTDDVGRKAFEDQVYHRAYGDKTPAFAGEPAWEGFTFTGWNPKVSDTVTRDVVYFASWKPEAPAEKVYTVTFQPGEGGTLNGRGVHKVPEGECVPLVPQVEEKEDYRFTGKWEVVEVKGESDFVQVGDILNEANISNLRIRFDLTLKALYEKTEKPTATPAPTATPRPTAAPTREPADDPTRTPNDYYFSFTKEWKGTPLDSISFTLYNPNGTVRQHRFNQKKISDTEWLYEAWLSSGGEYYVIEDSVAGYTTTYVNTGIHSGVKDRVYNAGKIINSSVPKTGDTFNPVLWIALAAGALACIGAVAYVASKKRGGSRKKDQE